jgi:hypothetical protein
MAEGQLAIPESASEQVKLILADVPIMRPPGPGVGEMVYEITGGVKSRLTGTLVGVLFPARSIAVPVID